MKTCPRRPQFVGRDTSCAKLAAVLVALTALSTKSASQTLPSDSPTSSLSRLVYPATRRDSVVDNYHGSRVADPYRWLENIASDETRAWVDAQQALTDSVLRANPYRDAILRRLGELDTILMRPPGLAVLGGRVYLTRKEEGKRLRLLYATRDRKTTGALLFDPNTVGLKGTEIFSNVMFAPDDGHVSYFVSPSGRDRGELRIRSVATGRDLPDTLRGLRSLSMLWLDRHTILYTHNTAAADTGGTEVTSPGRQLLLHKLGTRQADDRVLYTAGDGGAWIRPYAASVDARFVVFTERRGMLSAGVFVVDFTGVNDGRAPRVRRVLGAGEHFPLGFAGNRLFVRTQDGAPNSQIIAIDLHEGGGRRIVVPEGPEPMNDAILTADRLVVNVLRDVKSRLLLYAHDGSPRGEVGLPASGSVLWMLADQRSSEFFFQFTSTLTPGMLYRYDVASARASPLYEGAFALDASAFETRQLFFTSKDGTRVPMFLTLRRDAVRDGTTPVMVYAYGGFGLSLPPFFQPYIMTWLELGGGYALVNARGGGEYGAAWHQAAVGKRKQTTFDDVIAAAEFLVRERYSAPERLVLHGESNGGFTVGAVMTERPDLFAVSLPLSGVHDMFRFHRFTVGRNWASETGTADSAEMFPYIRAYSPLHNVRPGTCYPATFVMAAADDDRVVPSHSYKFAAALQAAQACARPILLHVSRGTSHMGGARSAELAQTADMLAFAANFVGLRIPATWRH
jgi:prolyl oligopeptidase